MLRIALISKWFVHADRFADYLKTYEECEIAAVHDYDSRRGEDWARKLGCPFVEDYNRILLDQHIDAVLIMVPVDRHAEYIVRAANAGKHIFTEKPLAGCVKDAILIRDAVKRSGIQFVVSDPVKKPPLMYAKDMMEKGLLGKITVVRVRITTDELTKEPHSEWRKNHTGKEMCGGDMIDIGHHSVHILHWLLGKAETAAAVYSQVTDFARKDNTEDNAVAVFGYADGTLGIAESGSIERDKLFEFEIYGTGGCIRGTKKQLSYSIGNEGWREVPEADWPKPYDYILHYWIMNIIKNRRDTMFGVEEAMEVLEMILAAYAAGNKADKIAYIGECGYESKECYT